MSERNKLIKNLVGPRPGHSAIPKTEIKNDEVSEINLLHQSILQDLSNAIQSAILIGEKLSNQKRIIGHGNWIPWMKANLEFSDSTAKRYIRLYENKTLLNRSPVTDLKSALQLISESKNEEKDVTPTASAVELYKKFASGQTLGKKDREVLRVWLKEKEKSIETKLKKIKSDLAKI